jgi:uncharacterized sulfatase
MISDRRALTQCCCHAIISLHRSSHNAAATPSLSLFTDPRLGCVVIAVAAAYGSGGRGCDDSICGVPGFKTPHFDRVAREGLLFTEAMASAPGCNPARAALFSGQNFWETERGAIEQGTAWPWSGSGESLGALPATWPLLLEKESGYVLGWSYEGEKGKVGNAFCGGKRTAFHAHGQQFGNYSLLVHRNAKETKKAAEKARNIAKRLQAEVRGNFQDFLDATAGSGDCPWCYCWGATNTHRDFAEGSGEALWGILPVSTVLRS